ncbi:MAG: ATP-binding cassette domain-containing protein [Clostridiales bacterium]|nr:ATP-binding cassette domain-containing protein [Clostridiales bacterium]
MAGPMKMKVAEKNNHKFSETYGKLIKFCKPNLKAIIIALVAAVAGTIFTLIGPDKLKQLTNAITAGVVTGIDLKLVTTIGLTLVAFYAFSIILSYTQGYIMGTVTQKVANGLRKNIASKINKLPLKYFDSHQTGDTISLAINDVDAIASTLNQSITSLVSAIVLFLGSILMMFITNWIMALVAIISSIIGFIFMFIIAGFSQKYFVKNQQLIGQINGHIEEVYSGHNVVKAYNAEKKLFSQFNEINQNLRKCGKTAHFLSGLMMPLMSFISNLGYLAVCIAGALLVVNGKIEIGTIVAFLVYVRLFTQPLSQIAQGMSSLQSCGAASYRVFEFLEQEELLDESQKNVKLNNSQGNISFRNIRFGYDSERTIIKNFSADIKHGQKVAIVGPTGAGKTTMVNLLMRFYELNQPRLIVNGKLTDHKIFDNGKSIRLLVDNKNRLMINNEKTDYVLKPEIAEKFPKEINIKFDQNFNMLTDDKRLDIKIDVLKGNNIDKRLNCNLGIGYYGDILIDGVPTKSLTRENIHNLFCMVLQDTWLFEGTIKENIIFNKQGITDEQVINACKTAGVHHFISTLPEGYNTYLNEDANVSAGQKQLLTIARAMVSNAPILILDEATSSVDTRTEELIQVAMDKLMTGRTSIVIAHRLSTIKNANLILVMKDGDIIESGNHEQLLAQNGFYAELYNSQFDKVS